MHVRHAHTCASDRVQALHPNGMQSLPTAGEDAGNMYPPKEAYMHLPP
jgi:hypothetical protein